MKTSTDYKNLALHSLEKKFDKGCVASLIYLLILIAPSTILQYFGQVSNAWMIAILPLQWGFFIYFLNLVRGGDLSYNHLFDGYRDFSRIFCTTLLECLYIFLWTLLLFVPGVIKSYSYAMTPYILKDNPQIGGNKAIEASMAMMQGHKKRLFMLDLSFLGWLILALIPAGLGMLLLYPYWLSARAHFYEELKAEAEKAANSQSAINTTTTNEDISA